MEILGYVHDQIRHYNGYNLCVCGDFNCSFAGSYCHTKFARTKLTEFFAETNMSLMTADGEQRIDHIAISNAFLEDAVPIIQEGELDKGISDHRWVSAIFIAD